MPDFKVTTPWETQLKSLIQTEPARSPAATTALLRELVEHLRQHRTELREEWARRITEAKVLTAMSDAEIFAEATSVYDNYVAALETGTFEALQTYSRNLSERMLHIRNDAFAQLGDKNLSDLKVTGKAPTFFVNPDLPDNDNTSSIAR